MNVMVAELLVRLSVCHNVYQYINYMYLLAIESIIIIIVLCYSFYVNSFYVYFPSTFILLFPSLKFSEQLVLMGSCSTIYIYYVKCRF